MASAPSLSPTALWRWDRLDGWLTAGLAVVVLLLYGRTIGYPFTNWDDIHFLTNNPALQEMSWENLQRIWTPGGVPKELIYIPLTYLSHLVESWLFGLTPTAVHASNVLLHLLCTMLVFVFCRELSRERWIAFLAALLFAVHPLQVEAVAWAMGRKDLLSTCFALASLIAYVHYLRNQSASWLGAALVGFLLAVLAKPTMLVLPLVMVLLDIYLPGPAAPRHWGQKIPFVLIALLVYMLNSRLPVDAVQDVPDLSFRLFSVPWIAATWVQRTFLLAQPVPFHVWPTTAQWLPVLLLGGVFTLALILVMVQSLRHGWRVVWFGLMFFAIGFLPTLNLVLKPRDFVTADRYGYFPLIGIFYLLAMGALRLPVRWRPLYHKWLGLFLLIAAAGSWLQVGIWQDSLQVWNRVRLHAPSHPLVRNNLAMSFIDAGQLDQAERQFRIGLQFAPNYLPLYENLGYLYLDQDRPEVAIAIFSRLVELAPEHPRYHHNLGSAYQRAGQFSDAIDSYVYTLALNEDRPETWLQLGTAYAAVEEPQRAAEAYREGLKRAPQHALLHLNLGILLEAQGEHQEAAQAYSQALRFQPNLEVAWYNMGTLYLQAGMLREARDALRQAVRLEPRAETFLNLARTQHELGDLYRAASHYHDAIERGTPHAAMAWFFLADVYLRQERPTQAREALQQALKLQPDLEPARRLQEQLTAP